MREESEGGEGRREERGKRSSEGRDGGWVVAERPNPFQNLQEFTADEQFCCLAIQLWPSSAWQPLSRVFVEIL